MKEGGEKEKDSFALCISRQNSVASGTSFKNSASLASQVPKKQKTEISNISSIRRDENEEDQERVWEGRDRKVPVKVAPSEVRHDLQERH